MVLRDYQLKDIEQMYEMQKLINANDMGLGKTIEAIGLANKIKASKVLIICPNSLKWNWLSEIMKWADHKRVNVIEGTPKKKVQLMSADADWYILGYGALQLVEDKTKPINPKALPEKWKYKKRFKYPELHRTWDLIIFDESQNLAGRKSDRTEGARKLDGKYIIQLTGTPILTSPAQLWSQLRIVDPKEFTSYWKFVDKWLITTANPFSEHQPKVVGIKDPEAFKQMLFKYMIRTEKKDVLTELPEKVYKTIEVRMSPGQQKLYNQMEQDAFATYKDSFTLASSAILQQLRLRQLCLDPAIVSEGFSSISSAKTDALLDYIDNIPGERQVVIFSEFRKYAEYLYQIISKKSTCVLYTGELSDIKRKEAEHDFRSGKARIFIGTIKAGGVGLNLQNASILIFTDKNWSPKINMQVEDRINRMGQKNVPEIISFITKNTVEEDIEELLSVRADMIDSVITTMDVFNAMKNRLSDLDKN